MSAVNLANINLKIFRFYGFIVTGTFVIQNASHVFVPGVVIASGPGVIVFVSREVSPLYPKDKLIYSSEL
jgi:hypothetical protein